MRSAQYAATLEWDRDVNLWAKQLESNAIAILEAFLSELVDELAPEIEQWMKDNALWTDRTGRARAGLHTEVEKMVGQVYTIVLDHGEDVPYGVWLELKNQGRYAIIQPALDFWFPVVWGRINEFVST